MWETIEFKTLEEQEKFIEKNKDKFQIEVIFINNGYALDVKPLLIIDIP